MTTQRGAKLPRLPRQLVDAVADCPSTTVELLEHGSLACLRNLGCCDVGLPDSELFDLDAEILPNASTQVAGDCLTLGMVGTKDNLHTGVTQHVSVKVGQALAGDHDDNAVLAPFLHQLGQGDIF